jgi:hypothetical protein
MPETRRIKTSGPDTARAYVSRVERYGDPRTTAQIDPADPAIVVETTMPETTTSRGHLLVSAGYEYFRAPSGDVYRAPTANPVMPDGYRAGGRFECVAGQWTHRRRNLGIPAEQPCWHCGYFTTLADPAGYPCCRGCSEARNPVA